MNEMKLMNNYNEITVRRWNWTPGGTRPSSLRRSWLRGSSLSSAASSQVNIHRSSQDRSGSPRYLHPLAPMYSTCSDYFLLIAVKSAPKSSKTALILLQYYFNTTSILLRFYSITASLFRCYLDATKVQ